MRIEMFQREYEYILTCFQKLLPQYVEKIRTTTFVDRPLGQTEIYVFELMLLPSDAKKIKELKTRLKASRKKEDFELLDELNEFFFFIEDNS